MNDQSSRQDHWAHAYTAKPPTEVSWFQVRPDLSLDLIEKTGASLDASIIDVGAGASTLVDHLLDAGRTSVAVLDIAEQTLAAARRSRCGSGNVLSLLYKADARSQPPSDQAIRYNTI